MANTNNDSLFMQPGQFGMNAPFTLKDLGGGAVSGGVGMGMLQQFNQNQDMQTQMNNLLQQANQARMQEYQDNSPVRNLQRSLELMYAGPEREQKHQQGAATLGKTQEDLARLRGTRDTEIIATNEGNKAKSEKSKLESMQSFYDRLDADSATWSGPDGLVQMTQWMDDNRMPQDHPLRKFAKQPGLTPEKFNAGIMTLKNKLAASISRRSEIMQVQERTKAEGAQTYRIEDMKKGWDYEIELIKQRSARSGGNPVLAFEAEVKKNLLAAEQKARSATTERESFAAQEEIKFWRGKLEEITRQTQLERGAGVPLRHLIQGGELGTGAAADPRPIGLGGSPSNAGQGFTPPAGWRVVPQGR